MPRLAECWGGPRGWSARAPSPLDRATGSGHSAPDQMNDPAKLPPPATAPGLFLPHQLQSSAHERLLRELNHQIDDIHRKLVRYEELFTEREDTTEEEEERRDKMRSEQDRNQEKIRLMRILGDWFAGANFDMETARIPITEDEMKQSYHNLSEAMTVVCQGLEKLRTINRTILTMCGHTCSPETKHAEKSCLGYQMPTSEDVLGHSMAPDSILAASTFLITSAGEFEQSQAVTEAWKKSANEVVNMIMQSRGHSTDLVVFEDKVMRMAHSLEEQNATIQNLQKHVVDRAMSENRCRDRMLMMNQRFDKLQTEFVRLVGEDNARTFLAALAEEAAKYEQRESPRPGPVKSEHTHGVGNCVDLETQMRELLEDNNTMKGTLDVFLNATGDRDAFMALIAEKDRMTKLAYAAEKRFQELTDGTPLDEVIRSENARLLEDQKSLQIAIRELESKVSLLEAQLVESAAQAEFNTAVGGTAGDDSDAEHEDQSAAERKSKTQKKTNKKGRGAGDEGESPRKRRGKSLGSGWTSGRSAGYGSMDSGTGKTTMLTIGAGTGTSSVSQGDSSTRSSRRSEARSKFGEAAAGRRQRQLDAEDDSSGRRTLTSPFKFTTDEDILEDMLSIKEAFKSHPADPIQQTDEQYEQKVAFMTMLKEAGVQIDTDIDTVVRMVGTDPRYQAAGSNAQDWIRQYQAYLEQLPTKRAYLTMLFESPEVTKLKSWPAVYKKLADDMRFREVNAKTPKLAMIWYNDYAARTQSHLYAERVHAGLQDMKRTAAVDKGQVVDRRQTRGEVLANIKVKLDDTKNKENVLRESLANIVQSRKPEPEELGQAKLTAAQMQALEKLPTKTERLRMEQIFLQQQQQQQQQDAVDRQSGRGGQSASVADLSHSQLQKMRQLEDGEPAGQQAAGQRAQDGLESDGSSGQFTGSGPTTGTQVRSRTGLDKIIHQQQQKQRSAVGESGQETDELQSDGSERVELEKDERQTDTSDNNDTSRSAASVKRGGVGGGGGGRGRVGGGEGGGRGRDDRAPDTRETRQQQQQRQRQQRQGADRQFGQGQTDGAGGKFVYGATGRPPTATGIDRDGTRLDQLTPQQQQQQQQRQRLGVAAAHRGQLGQDEGPVDGTADEGRFFYDERMTAGGVRGKTGSDRAIRSQQQQQQQRMPIPRKYGQEGMQGDGMNAEQFVFAPGGSERIQQLRVERLMRQKLQQQQQQQQQQRQGMSSPTIDVQDMESSYYADGGSGPMSPAGFTRSPISSSTRVPGLQDSSSASRWTSKSDQAERSMLPQVAAGPTADSQSPYAELDRYHPTPSRHGVKFDQRRLPEVASDVSDAGARTVREVERTITKSGFLGSYLRKATAAALAAMQRHEMRAQQLQAEKESREMDAQRKELRHVQMEFDRKFTAAERRIPFQFQLPSRGRVLGRDERPATADLNLPLLFGGGTIDGMRTTRSDGGGPRQRQPPVGVRVKDDLDKVEIKLPASIGRRGMSPGAGDANLDDITGALKMSWNDLQKQAGAIAIKSIAMGHHEKMLGILQPLLPHYSSESMHDGRK